MALLQLHVCSITPDPEFGVHRAPQLALLAPKQFELNRLRYY